ncbi:MAG: DUF3795 domain-containing protein [Candidatus Heimdallarchaeota archaeon]|nr:DUF3795 domain-containing protein [Candidatus Heimdallarchaeota archaeon]
MKLIENPIAVCGLECDKCDIYLMNEDEEIAEKMLRWFKKKSWRPESFTIEELMQEGPFCLGCRGDPEKHWSADCYALKCAKEKNIDSCHKCEDFVCDWYDGATRKYAEGIERLKKIQEKS